jgi:hypothetical protein
MLRKLKATPPLALPERLDSSLNNLVRYVMRRVQMKITQDLTNRLEEHDIRPAQFTALHCTDHHRAVNGTDACRLGQNSGDRAATGRADGQQAGSPRQHRCCQVASSITC